jgi:hypothetical protein
LKLVKLIYLWWMIKLNIDIPNKMLNSYVNNNIPHTYKDGRCCRYCKNPLPDHTNKSREFCEKRVFSDGRTMDCKSLYWTPERRQESKIEKQQQQICSSFKELVDHGKTEMSWEEFCFMGFSLKMAKQTYPSSEKKIVAIFEGGYLLIDPNTYNIKIVKQ